MCLMNVLQKKWLGLKPQPQILIVRRMDLLHQNETKRDQTEMDIYGTIT